MGAKLRDIRGIKVGDRVGYKQSGEGKEVSKGSFGACVCIRTDSGEELWVDVDQLRDK